MSQDTRTLDSAGLVGDIDADIEKIIERLRDHPQARFLMPHSPWMTPEETARYLTISVGTLRNWTSAKYIPHAKRGRVVRYHRPTIDAWLENGACRGRSTIANEYEDLRPKVK